MTAYTMTTANGKKRRFDSEYSPAARSGRRLPSRKAGWHSVLTSDDGDPAARPDSGHASRRSRMETALGPDSIGSTLRIDFGVVDRRCRAMSRCDSLSPGSPWRKSPLHSSGDASRLTALFVGYICPICALLTPCQAGASPLSVQREVSPRAAERLRRIDAGSAQGRPQSWHGSRARTPAATAANTAGSRGDTSRSRSATR